MRIIGICLVAINLIACNSAEVSEQHGQHDTEEPLVNKESTNKMSALKIELEARKSNFELKASDVKKKKYAEGIQDIINNQIVENALQKGDTAPNFDLSNALGENVNLYQALEKGPVVLMWYRGGWCPYCNITLHYMQDNLEHFEKYGARLLALTPELPDSSLSTSEKNELKFEVLSDIDNHVAKDYNIVFKLTDDVANFYESGFGLSQYNGNANNELPLAATYVIGMDRIIKYAFLDADYRNRAEPEVILDILKTL